MKTTDPKKRALLDGLKDGLIVSCQVQKDDPIYTDDIVVKMAEAAKWAGAVAIRANSPEQIKAIKDKVDYGKSGMTIQMFLSHRRWMPQELCGRQERKSSLWTVHHRLHMKTHRHGI